MSTDPLLKVISSFSGAIAWIAEDLQPEIATMAEGFLSLERLRRKAAERQEAEMRQWILDRVRREQLAAFEASDPAGRLAEMDARHRAEAARLRAEYPEVDR